MAYRNRKQPRGRESPEILARQSGRRRSLFWM